ncbi:MAG: acylneuraminate cytidylyltransferase [Aureispira sp.]|nr:acylneuraminate cytidylyltransferase [Aureispira sp.]
MKIGIISQARMTSTRLPGKVLKTANDIPLLKYHIDRLAQSNLPIFIATTINKTDDPVVELCKKEGIPYYRGDENHVLSRYYECAKEYDLDVVVRVTSDCPLIDGKLIESAWQKYQSVFEDYDYISNVIERSYPRGVDFEIFSFVYLKEAFEKAISPSEIEHVTPYIHQNNSGRTNYYHILQKGGGKQYRITVDTPEDFELIKILIEAHQAHTLSASEIIGLLDKHPELVKINTHIEQKKI